ncbi:MAG: hypothetical protein KBB83_03380 [Alphaproteobacteria bacterium]|nr:hypothetical protein [Alphaproteobacteria bacterium]
MKYVLLGLSVIVAMPLMASNSDMDSEEIFMGRGSLVSSYDSRSYVDRHTAMTPSEEKERFERIFFEEVSSEKKTAYVPPKSYDPAPYVPPMVSDDEIRQERIRKLSFILSALQQRNDPEHFKPIQDWDKYFESLSPREQNLVELDDKSFNAVIEYLKDLLNQEYSYEYDTADTDDSVGSQVSEDTSSKPLEIISLKSFIIDKCRAFFHKK